LLSQTGVAVGQSLVVTQPTHAPVLVSHTVAPSYDAHWLESVQPSHAFVTALQTGIAAVHPSVAQVSCRHWLLTQVSPWSHAVTVLRPAWEQSSAETQQAFGLALVEQPPSTSNANMKRFTI
jgi:hypothetical protein